MMGISVVIPTKGRDGALERCIKALGKWRGEPLGGAVVVTDDGRSVETRMLCERLGARYTEGPQRGPAANRNHGAKLVKADMLIFLDDDVVPGPGLLEAYFRAFKEDIVYEGQVTCLGGLASPLEEAPENLHGGRLWSCNMMLRRGLFEYVGGFDERFRYPHMEDVAFKAKLDRLGIKTKFVPDATVDHPPRIWPDAKTRAAMNEAFVIYERVYEGMKPSFAKFLGGLLRHRVGKVLQHPPSVDSLIALGSTAAEIAHIAKAWKGWAERWPAPRPREVP